MTYRFNYRQRVYCRANGKYGKIDSMVPGNGKDAWYYIEFEDGSSDRFTDSDLEAA